MEARTGAPGPVPGTNVVIPEPDGPLYLSGGLELAAGDGTPAARDTHIALCCRGASRNRPSCCGSHTETDLREG